MQMIALSKLYYTEDIKRKYYKLMAIKILKFLLVSSVLLSTNLLNAKIAKVTKIPPILKP